MDGNYELTVPSLDVTLVFSYVGYQRVEMPLEGQTTLDVELQMQIYGEEELVVVGYGTQSRETLTGSISSISGERLERAPVSNISNTLTGNVSFDQFFGDRRLWETPWTLYTWDYNTFDDQGEPVLTGASRGPTEPQLRQWSSDSREIMLNLTANYRQDFQNHSFNILVGTEQQRFQGSTMEGFRRGFISSQVDQLFAGAEAQREITGSANQGARMNYFARFNYDYQSKYLLEFVGRYDGSYIFPEDRRFGFFPAFSAGWRLTQEDWFTDLTGFFDELRIRGSWGQTGNDRIDEWQYLATFGFGDGFVFDQQNISSIFQTRTPNPNITWEVANQFDIGFEAEFLDNRFTAEFAYFKYKREDILHFRNASIPHSAGFSLPCENIGQVASSGFDGALTYRSQVTPNFLFDITLNASYAENEILFWDEPPGAPEWQRSTGAPMNTNLYYKAIGVFQTWEDVENYPSWEGARPGDIIFWDTFGLMDPEARNQAGHYYPQKRVFNFGFSLTF